MKKNILIVDAYNMIGNWPQLDKLKKSDRLEDARDLLLKILSNYLYFFGKFNFKCFFL